MEHQVLVAIPVLLASLAIAVSEPLVFLVIQEVARQDSAVIADRVVFLATLVLLGFQAIADCPVSAAIAG